MRHLLRCAILSWPAVEALLSRPVFLVLMDGCRQRIKRTAHLCLAGKSRCLHWPPTIRRRACSLGRFAVDQSGIVGKPSAKSGARPVHHLSLPFHSRSLPSRSSTGSVLRRGGNLGNEAPAPDCIRRGRCFAGHDAIATMRRNSGCATWFLTAVPLLAITGKVFEKLPGTCVWECISGHAHLL